MAEITSLASRNENCFSWSVEQCLRQVIEDLREGRIDADAILVLTHKTNGDSVDIRRYRARLTAGEEVTLTSYAQVRAIERLRGT